MSTTSTIILTKHNEHWYQDSSEPLNSNNDAITLEFSKKNIRIDLNDDEDLIITITNPNSDIYSIISNLK
jgi:hypothetical protein